MTSKNLARLVAIATLAFVISPFLTIGFNGFEAAQFPIPQEDPPVQPAGYAFSIWGIIYVWLVVAAAYGVLRSSDDPDWQAMRLPLALSLTIGAFWLAAANAAPILATVMIIVMAGLAIRAMLKAGETRPWLQVGPVAIYAGWLTAASGVGTGVVLAGYGLVSAQVAAILCLIGVLAVALSVQAARPSALSYPAAVIWALVGVIVANLATSNWLIIGLAIIGITLLIARSSIGRNLMAQPARGA